MGGSRENIFFLLSDNLIVLMLPAIYTQRKGKEGMITGSIVTQT